MTKILLKSATVPLNFLSIGWEKKNKVGQGEEEGNSFGWDLSKRSSVLHLLLIVWVPDV